MNMVHVWFRIRGRDLHEDHLAKSTATLVISAASCAAVWALVRWTVRSAAAAHRRVQSGHLKRREADAFFLFLGIFTALGSVNGHILALHFEQHWTHCTGLCFHFHCCINQRKRYRGLTEPFKRALRFRSKSLKWQNLISLRTLLLKMITNVTFWMPQTRNNSTSHWRSWENSLFDGELKEWVRSVLSLRKWNSWKEVVADGPFSMHQAIKTQTADSKWPTSKGKLQAVKSLSYRLLDSSNQRFR